MSSSNNYNHNFYRPDPRSHEQRRDLLVYRDLLDRIDHLDKPDPVADTAWIPVGSTNLVDADEAPPLQGNWKTNLHHPLYFRLDESGRVWFKGWVYADFGVTETGTIFTLPEWARPEEDVLIPSAGNAAGGRGIHVTTAGAVSAIARDALRFSFNINFDGCHFRAWQQDEDEDFNDGDVDVPDDFAFEDGFESGDFSAWDLVQGAPTVVSSPVHDGSFSMSGNVNDWVTHTFADQSDGVTLTARCWVYLPQAYIDEIVGYSFSFAPIYFNNDEADYQWGVYGIVDGGTLYWGYDDDTNLTVLDGGLTTEILADTWLEVVAQATFTNGGTGLVEGTGVTVNGVVAALASGSWNWGSTYSPVSQVDFGGGGALTVENYYIDDCAVTV